MSTNNDGTAWSPDGQRLGVGVDGVVNLFGPFPEHEGIAQPAPDWLAILALLAGSAVLVGIASLRARHMEISYTSE